MTLRRSAKDLAILSAKALLLCNIIVLLNLVAVSLIWPGASDIGYSVAFITLLEGGIGFTIGGLSVIATGPSISKISEKVLHSQPYSPKRARDAEARARLFFFFSTFLVVIGFALSV